MKNTQTTRHSILLVLTCVSSCTHPFLFENQSSETIYIATFQTAPHIAHFLSAHGWSVQDINRIRPANIGGIVDKHVEQKNLLLAMLAREVTRAKIHHLQSKTWLLKAGKQAVWNWKAIQRELKDPNCTHLFCAIFACTGDTVNYKSLRFLSPVDIKARLSYLSNGTLSENFYETRIIESTPVQAHA